MMKKKCTLILSLLSKGYSFEIKISRSKSAETDDVFGLSSNHFLLSNNYSDRNLEGL